MLSRLFRNNHVRLVKVNYITFTGCRYNSGVSRTPVNYITCRYNSGVSRTPECMLTSLKEATCLITNKQSAEALQKLDDVIEADPDAQYPNMVLRAWTLKACALQGENRHEEVVIACDKANEIQKSPEIYQMQGWTQTLLGNYEKAIESYDCAIALDSNISDVWYTRGDALMKLNRLEEAISSFDKSISVDPQYIKPYRLKGCALGQLGRDQEAVQPLQKATSMNPDDVDMLRALSVCYSNLGNAEDALVVTNKLLSLQPEHVDSLLDLGPLLFAVGRFDEAIVATTKAIKLNPNDALNWGIQGHVWCQLGRDIEALASFKKSIALNPTDSACAHTCGFILFSQQRYTEAIEVLDNALNANSDDFFHSKLLSLKADAEFNLSRSEDALMSCNRALALDPQCRPAWRVKIQALDSLGRKENSLQALAAARENIPDFEIPKN